MKDETLEFVFFQVIYFYCVIVLNSPGCGSLNSDTDRLVALVSHHIQPGPLSLVEECRGSSLIGRELPQ